MSSAPHEAPFLSVPSTAAALSAKDLSVEVTAPGRAVRHVVRGVSLELTPGTVTVLVGESGSGKTMTALALIRLLPRQARMSASDITLDGQDVLALDDRSYGRLRGSKISMIFQDPLAALNPVKKIGFQVTEPMLAHLGISRREATTRAVSLLDQLGLPSPARVMQRYPHELSGGMRQRVLIAFALAADPVVLIADEATTALDVSVQAQIIDLIKSLAAERNLAVLFVTHDLAVANEIGDRIAVMYGGVIVEEGHAADVLQRPVHPYTRALLACVPRLDKTVYPLPSLKGGVQGVWEIASGCRFAPRCAFAEDACSLDEPKLEFALRARDTGLRKAACRVFAARK